MANMANTKSELFRLIPAVDRLLESDDLKSISESYPRNLILRAINDILAGIRKAIENEEIDKERLGSLIGSIAEIIKEKLFILSQPSLKNVINATGVVIHTNLGRSILADRVIKRFKEIGGGYSNLEYDLKKGRRGSRYSHVEGILKELTSAEAAMVVNNNAAAVLIVLETFAKEREVIISRGELVEIGGSFRIPDVMKKSGAKMVEVGTTNKTHLKDYEEAINKETAAVLKVHRSNFHIVGFNEEVDRITLVELGKKHKLPVIEDLGSGSLIDLRKYGMAWEPTVQSVLESGVDLVTFSGDKLLGGPQAGIILGKKELVEKVRQNQLSRALRIDKLTLLALEETLNIYRDERKALDEIPTMRMISESYSSLKSKAGRLNRMIKTKDGGNFTVDTSDGTSKVGGGALPLMELSTRLIRLTPKAMSAQQIHESFKSKDVPIIVRVEHNKVLLDVRTIQESELATVAAAISDLNSM